MVLYVKLVQYILTDCLSLSFFQNMSRPKILSEVARSFLPAYSMEQVSDMLDARGEFTDREKAVLYAHYLIARGDAPSLFDFVDGFAIAERAEIVNAKPHDAYYGNTLHTAAYWNTGETALNIVRFLLNAGATACHNYYEHYPWEDTGVAYVCPVRFENIAPDCDRDPSEFTETYAAMRRYFPDIIPDEAPVVTWTSAAVSVTPTEVDPLIATCILHRPSSLYTRNSEGYYGMYVPMCNGCSRGAQEAEESAAADAVRGLTYELQNVWMVAYNNGTSGAASEIAEHLIAATNRLDTISGIISSPQQYAARVLDAHRAAVALSAALGTLSTADETHFLGGMAIARANVRARLDALLSAGARTIDPRSFPIVTAAQNAIGAA